MRLSILATTLAVLTLPATAVPHKVGRCVPKSSIAPSSSSAPDAFPSNATEGNLVQTPGNSSSQAELPSATPSPTSESSVSSESLASTSSATESSPSEAPTSSEPVPAPSSSSDSATTEATPSPTSSTTPPPSSSVLIAPEDKADGSSDAFRDQILQLHNQLRAEYGAPDLTWEQSLGDSAATWVDQCSFGSSGTPYTSENIAAGQGTNLLPYLFSQWAQEKDVYDMDNPGLHGFNGGATGHFTQIVWKSSSSLGCAWKACPADKIQPGWTETATYLVCQYSPPGNYAPGGNGTIQSFCDNVGCSDAARSKLPLTDSIQGTTVGLGL